MKVVEYLKKNILQFVNFYELMLSMFEFNEFDNVRESNYYDANWAKSDCEIFHKKLESSCWCNIQITLVFYVASGLFYNLVA